MVVCRHVLAHVRQVAAAVADDPQVHGHARGRPRRRGEQNEPARRADQALSNLAHDRPFLEGLCWLAGDRSPGFRAPAPRLPGGRELPSGVLRRRFARSQWRDRAGLLTGLPLTTGRMWRGSLPRARRGRSHKERGGPEAAPLRKRDYRMSLLLLLLGLLLLALRARRGAAVGHRCCTSSWPGNSTSSCCTWP